MIAKLNPANSLFGRIFIWFWLSVSVLLIAAFLTARFAQTQIDISQPNERQETMGTRAIAAIQTIIDEREVNIERAIRRSSSRGRWRIVMVNLDKQEVKVGFPDSLLPSSSRATILDLASSDQLVLVTTPQLEFIGPYALSAEGESYQIFIGRLLRRDERAPVSWGIGLVLILSIGSLLCLVLAYRLSKPLGELRAASLAFADGDLQSRVKGQEQRKDEIGQLAADFNNMADKLNASMQQQQLLLANVSHELRTPLTRMQLAVAILHDKATSQAEGVENNEQYISRIEHEIANMDKLIGQILSLTRMQNMNKGLIAEQHRAFQSVLLSNLFDPLLQNLQFEASALGKNIHCGDIPQISVSINPDALSSGVENILRNAIKFSSSDVWLSFDTNETAILIHIDDDGKGLDEHELQNLFEPFYQVSNSTKDSTGGDNASATGFGLGLAIAKAAIDLHGGTLSAVSSERGGLRFTVSLPMEISSTQLSSTQE